MSFISLNCIVFFLNIAERKEGDLFKGCTDTPVYNEIDIPATEDWDTGNLLKMHSP